MPSYEPLTVVASDDYQDGYRTYGVLDGGAFVPLGGQKIGHVEALAAAVDENDPHVAAQPEPQPEPQQPATE